MSTLKINRRSEWTNRARKIGLYLDKEKIGTIEDGEIKDFKISPGNYILRAKIDWCGSQTYNIQLRKDETKAFELTGFKKNKAILPVLILVQLLLVVLSYYIRIDSYLMQAFSFTLLLYILYPITFGRNFYLNLIEIS